LAPNSAVTGEFSCLFRVDPPKITALYLDPLGSGTQDLDHRGSKMFKIFSEFFWTTTFSLW
jgi:hypothetical protein